MYLFQTHSSIQENLWLLGLVEFQRPWTLMNAQHTWMLNSSVKKKLPLSWLEWRTPTRWKQTHYWTLPLGMPIEPWTTKPRFREKLLLFLSLCQDFGLIQSGEKSMN